MLHLYRIDMKYIRNLANTDKRVYSVSPQTGKSERPYLGLIVICDGRKYCIPLTTPKDKHNNMANRIDFTKMIVEDEFIGAINFSRMIPVEIAQLSRIDLKIRRHDSSSVTERKKRLKKTLSWCSEHEVDIVNKANVLYRKYKSGEAFHRRKNCLDFPALESACDKYNQVSR